MMKVSKAMRAFLVGAAAAAVLILVAGPRATEIKATLDEAPFKARDWYAVHVDHDPEAVYWDRVRRGEIQATATFRLDDGTTLTLPITGP